MNTELFRKYCDGELTVSEAAELANLLQTNESAKQAFARYVMDEGLFMEAVRCLAETQTQADHAVESRSMRRRVFIVKVVAPLMALGASLAMVAGGVWWFGRQAASTVAPGLELRVAEVRGQCSVFIVQCSLVIGDSSVGGRGRAAGVTESPSHQVTKSKVTGPTTLRPGDILRPGDGVEVGADGVVKLAYRDGTRVELQQNTRLRVTLGTGEEKDAKRLALDGGRLVCSAAAQRKPFLLETAHAVAEVVGTRFSLAENRDQTTLAVEEGRVDLHQKDQRLEVSAGETAVADAAGMRKLAPADAWITELLARAEAGSWDVVNLGTGVYSNDVWRMDARGGPAERRIWNMISGGSDRHHMVSFRDGKRWARGVVVGRMMILPERQAALEVVGAAPATSMAWRTYNYSVSGAPAAYQKLQIASVSLNFGPPGKEKNYNCGILHTAECAANVWYRFAAYFDAETPDGLRCVKAAWLDEHVATPQAAAWESSGERRFSNMKFEIGLEAKGVRMVTQGLKFVPLGPDLPPPPPELRRAPHR